ncbi:tRNA pseudouridine(13) synthase TruD [Halarcobacter bivalviorum]|uniref:tRNA pseudouridine synthase D n=1 Tax=Halarcobacter bivalviorum TaxID=663364 RepID=A0AAX2AAM2_9BACT|nr:tRNA pseudouridine(13) synthase TruD [Halarcobacter bivalviorum]AXH13262.1 tRNA pseudouridine 13 synthase [Halarcobacter bivalviorum]RXK10133.1 pseudouridine synthase [Halarcobacter bivalviorum]
MIKREFIQKHKPINFKFYQNIDDFIVVENPIKFTNRGNFIIAKIKKKSLGTWDLLESLSKGLRIYENELGYAGLKDKNATTTQYISIPRKYAKDLNKFRHPKIEIKETFLHSTKLNIGDLESNSFEITLHEVKEEDLYKIEKLLKEISKAGMPNYFGFQRFGHDAQENLDKARRYIYGDLLIKDRKLAKMLVSAYQSDFFNKWLVARLAHSNEEFKALAGDVFRSYKDDKFFTPKSLTENILEDFKNRKIVPTGLLPGRYAFRSTNKARKIEEKYDDTYIQEKGYRRDAIVYPKDINISYNKETSKCTLKFTLPKGSYATVLIENIANRNLRV